MKLAKQFVLVAAVLAALAAGGASLQSLRADVGSVTVAGATKDSITVSWTLPSGEHRLEPGTYSYEVHFEVADGKGGYPYHRDRVTRRVTTAGQTSAVLEPLEPDTLYQIRVEAWAEKKVGGDFINAKLREVGVIKQKTLASTAGANLRIDAIDGPTVKLALGNHGARFHMVRIAYKLKWSTADDLNAVARDPQGNYAWLTPTPERGLKEFDIDDGIVASFGGLHKRSKYEFVAYGFNVGAPEGVKLGQAMATTGGARPLSSVADNVCADYEDLLDLYGRDVSKESPAQPETPVIDLALPCLPEAYYLREKLLVDEGEDLANNFTMLKFLIESRSDVFQCWQEGELRPYQRTLEAFVREDSGVEEEILAEIDPAPAVFARGDANVDGAIDISDGVHILGVRFVGNGESIFCNDAADANDDGAIDLSDPVFIFAFLFMGGRGPSSPGGICGVDPTEDALDCEEYPVCK